MTLSAADIANEIIRWRKLNSRQKWQRKALYLLVKNGLVDDLGVEALTDLAIQERDPNSKQLPADDAVDVTDFGASGVIPTSFKLLAFRHVSGVNALKPNQELKFSEDGVTVIFGRNGTGKSGYVRALKQIGISQGSLQPIRSNIYEKSPSPKSVALQIKVNGVEPAKSTTVDLEAEDITRVNEIHIFDADTNTVSVDKQNAIHFEPHGVAFLTALSDVYDRVKLSLEVRLNSALEKQIEFPIGGSSGPMARLLTRPTSEMDIELVSKFATLGAEDQKKFTDMSVEFGPYADEDRSQRLANVRGRIKRLEDFVDKTRRLAILANNDELLRLEEAHGNLGGLQAEAKTATFPSDMAVPLEGVLSEDWIELWNAAESFSLNHAYVGHQFPKLDNSLCVFCMQSLQPDAVKRLGAFHLAVQQLAASAFAVAAKNYSNSLVSMIDQADDIELPATFGADLGGNSALLGKVGKYASSLQSRIKSLPVSPEEPWPAIAELPVDPSGEIVKLVEAAKGQEATITKAGSADSQAPLKAEYEDLRLRQWVADHLQDVTVHFESAALENVIRAAISTTDTNSVTSQVTKLTKSLVEEPLINGFADNLRELGLKGLHVEASTAGRKGSLVQQIKLSEEPRTTVSAVASEGEFRVVGLATFLSEAAIAGNCKTVVFDDPTRSLDHRFRRRIARRLAKESTKRQVIVFSHDIAFIHRLVFECADVPVDISFQWLDSQEIGKGIVSDGPPWELEKTTARIGKHKSFVQNFANKFGLETESVQIHEIKSELNLIRETWERATEEVLLNGGIERFGTDISTGRLSVIHDITEEVLDELEKGMSRCSEMMYGHDPAGILSDDPPTIEELKIEVIRIDEWRTDIVNRRKK